MMKKSLIALAIMAASSTAFAATSNVDVYGKMRVSISNADNGSGYLVTDEASRIGFKGSEDLGGGMSAIWGLELEVNLDDNDGTGLGDGRNAFVGLKSGLGTLLAGTHDTPYKLAGSADLFADTRADSQIGTTGIIGRNALDNRAENAVAYISPDWNGFHFAAATVAGETSSMGANAATSFALVYVNGPLKATYGHEKFADSASAGGNDGQQGDKLNVSYKLGDTTLAATYEKSKPAATTTAKLEKDKAYLVSVAHNMGPITLNLQHGNFNDKETDTSDVKRTTVGATYNLSKRTNVYVAYSKDNNGGTTADVTTTFAGLNHDF